MLIELAPPVIGAEHGVVEVPAALGGDELEHAVDGVDDDARP